MKAKYRMLFKDIEVDINGYGRFRGIFVDKYGKISDAENGQEYDEFIWIAMRRILIAIGGDKIAIFKVEEESKKIYSSQFSGEVEIGNLSKYLWNIKDFLGKRSVQQEMDALGGSSLTIVNKRVRCIDWKDVTITPNGHVIVTLRNNDYYCKNIKKIVVKSEEIKEILNKKEINLEVNNDDPIKGATSYLFDCITKYNADRYWEEEPDVDVYSFAKNRCIVNIVYNEKEDTIVMAAKGLLDIQFHPELSYCGEKYYIVRENEDKRYYYSLTDGQLIDITWR